jgi:hypothetical protein
MNFRRARQYYETSGPNTRCFSNFDSDMVVELKRDMLTCQQNSWILPGRKDLQIDPLSRTGIQI